MKKIHRAVCLELLPPITIALMVLTFVVFTREFGRLAELLIRKNASLSTTLEVVISLLPSVLVFTLPIGFLIGTLIAFSRLSTDSEIVAMRACGVTLWEILKPVLAVGGLVGLVTFQMTFFWLPEGNWGLRMLRQEIGLRPVLTEIKPRVFNEDLPGMVLYIEDVNLATSSWKGVFLADESKEGVKRIIMAREGAVILSPQMRRLQLHFDEGSIYTIHEDQPERDSVSHFETLDVPIPLPESDPVQAKVKRPEDKTFAELMESRRRGGPEESRSSTVELHSRIALPLSALIFAVLGVTLGIRNHRGGRGYGFVVSVVVAFLYYILFATGKQLAETSVVSVLIGVWGANFLFGTLSLLSLRIAHADADLLHRLLHNRLLTGGMALAQGLLRYASRFAVQGMRRLRHWLWDFSVIRVGVARVIDLYLIRKFCLYSVPTLLVCVALFYLFTFFELIDDVFSRQIPYSLLIEYFIFLLPHVLTLLVPISVLIGTLMVFGVLEKTNQLVAFKSCGISLYRVALPTFAVAAVMSLGIYLMQEYVLPYANQRQENLRNHIKGRPAQTIFQMGHNWIFGEDERLYHYSYFDPENQVFGELSIYRLDFQKHRLREYLYAERARWEDALRVWQLSKGWRRDYRADFDAFESFTVLPLVSAEPPNYFSKEVRESHKMTYPELRQYIEELQTAGFEVDHLRTELFKKVAFPFVSLIMAVLGVPFAVSTGRKGALFGIASGVLIGIFYWGTFGVFGVLGANGLLAPVLAAWGPNLLFGTSAVLLLSSART